MPSGVCYDSRRMPMKAVVIGKTLLVRQPIVQALAALDFQVTDASEPAAISPGVDLASHTLIVMDADGMAKDWRMLAAEVNARPGAPALVLVASRSGFDDVHDAMALKVAGIILKPFRRDEHTARLLDLALRSLSLKARRSAPRFAIPAAAKAVLTLAQEGSEEKLEVKNVALGGARLDAEAAAPGPPLVPGGFFPLSMLSWGDVQLEVDVDVVYRNDDSAGVQFSRIYEGKHNLVRALEERHALSLGSQGRKRRW